MTRLRDASFLSEDFDRDRLRRNAAGLTAGLWIFHFLTVYVRIGLIPAAPQAIAARMLLATAVGLVSCILMYLLIERLRRSGFLALALALLPSVVAAGLLTAGTLVAWQFLGTGGKWHADAEWGRFASAASYWSWFYLAWAGLVVALMHGMAGLNERSDARAGAGEDAYLRDLWISHRGRVVRIALSEVVWLQAAGDYIVVHADGRQYMTHDSLSSLERRLDPAEFLRVHRSSMVRLRAIEAVERMKFGALRLQLSDGSRIAVSRSYKGAVQAILIS
jgi:hypothetical protein